MDDADDYTVLDILDVRHSACDADGFAQQVAVLLLHERPVIVDLSRYEDHGNRILLRMRREAGAGQ